MIYRNKQTGAEINIPCELTGGDWERVETAPEVPEKEKAGEKDAAIRNSRRSKKPVEATETK